MPLSNQSNMNFTLEPFDEDNYDEEDAEDERFNGLLVRRSTSYSLTKKKLNTPTKLSARQSSETIAIDQAVACALKSRPKVFQYTQKHLQHVSPSIACLAICESLRELDLSGNELQSLPKEIERLRFIETCNLGKRKSTRRRDEMIEFRKEPFLRCPCGFGFITPTNEVASVS